MNCYPFDQPFFVALTQALGVDTNVFNPATTPLPATTQVDYVRVWKLPRTEPRPHLRHPTARGSPAVALMRRMIDDGAVGEVRLWRASWLSDEFTDPATPI